MSLDAIERSEVGRDASLVERPRDRTELYRGDAHTGTLDVKLAPAELERRRAGWTPRKTDFTSGYLWKYAEQVGNARGGAVTHPGGAAEVRSYADI